MEGLFSVDKSNDNNNNKNRREAVMILSLF